MGLRIMGSSSLGKYTPPNPNPNKFKIIDVEPVGKLLVCRIHYPECTTYEGYKIAVYNATIVQLINQTSLDPHFNDKGDFVPIARFPATPWGWRDALNFAKGHVINGTS